jgi:hypothetical protein
MTEEDEEFNRIEREAAMRKEAVAASVANHYVDGGHLVYPTAQRTERNFCERCGKRLAEGHIHTCTPPEKNT